LRGRAPLRQRIRDRHQGPGESPRRQPREEPTALLAAAYFLSRDDKAMQAVIDEVEKHNPAAAVFYTELADNLDRRRFYHDSEKHFKKAMALEEAAARPACRSRPSLHAAGQGGRARKLLDKAFDADEFNLRIDNTLKVLRHLDGYETLKTEHFILRTRRTTTVLARVMAKYLEEIYTELAAKFDYRPTGPHPDPGLQPPRHVQRPRGAAPDLHTIGPAGKMIAMVSPRDTSKVIGRPFNWRA
jgi:hypothetical protein